MDMIDQAGLLERHPWVRRHKLTFGDYHRMGEAGILGPEDRVELIEGEIVQMAPIGSEHSGTVNGLNRKLVLAVGDRAVVGVQNPIRLGDHSEPQPDFTLLRPRAYDYRAATPVPADVLLVIEVAQSSPRYHRGVKLALYARHGIPELWIVDVNAGLVEVWRSPSGERYEASFIVGSEAVVEPLLLPGVVIPMRGLIGPV